MMTVIMLITLHNVFSNGVWPYTRLPTAVPSWQTHLLSSMSFMCST